MLKKIATIKYLIIICLVLIFSLVNQNIARAEETGCCEISPAGLVPYVKNLTEDNCKLNNISGPDFNSTAVFHVDQKVSDDGKSCVNKTTNKIKEPIKIVPPVLSVSIPGFGKFSEVKCDDKNPDCAIPWMAEYLSAIFEYSIKIIGILAIIVIMLGGIIWLTAAGSKERLGQAMNFIKGGILGIVIALCSWALLFILNPNLVILKSININYIENEDLLPMQEPLTDDVTPGTIKSKGMDCFLNTFGSSEKEVGKHMVYINFIGHKTYVHKLAKEAFEKVSKEVEGKLGNYKIIWGVNDSGTWAWRPNVNNKSELSLHSFGIAVDINPRNNPNYKPKTNPCKKDIPDVLINAFKNNGFRWGGDFRKVCDSMHFEWLGPCQE